MKEYHLMWASNWINKVSLPYKSTSFVRHSLDIPSVIRNNLRKETLDSISFDNRSLHDLYSVETGVSLTLYYRGHSKIDWVYEGSFRDEYDLSTIEQIEKELTRLNHFGLQDCDRFRLTLHGGFSLSSITWVINDVDVEIVAASARVINAFEHEDTYIFDEDADL